MKKIFLFLFLPIVAFAEIGKYADKYPLPLEQPFGMALFKDNLVIADRATGKLHTFSLAERKIVNSMPLPCDQPLGIAADADGLWISDRGNKRILHFLPHKNKTDLVLSADLEAEVPGLGWDGKALWATSQNKFLKMDPSDGTEIRTFPMGAGMDATGIFDDGKYLWITERQRNLIGAATRDGEIFGFLPSPGPYPAGIVKAGNDIWVVDFEERVLYRIDASFKAEPFYAGKPHRRGLRFEDKLINRGPSNEVNGKIYACVGVEDVHQKFIQPLAFEPSRPVFVTDAWGQKFALLEGNIPAMKELSLAYTVQVETKDVNYFILPEWVESLDKIPADIRQKYLQDGSKLKTTDPYIGTLVKTIVGDEKNPFWIAFKIHKYLHFNIAYQMTGGWNAAPTILKRGTGSCSEFAFCFIALARAAGLPARYEAGIVVRGDEGSIDDVYHRWVQVYLPPFGWIPADPSSGKPAAAADVALRFGSLSHRFFITTHSGGDSPYLGWTYNYKSFYEFSGKAIVEEKNEAKWSPLPAAD
ncbi:MAG TPA: transglutaminase domain-containing protein [Candidatus Aminicenantes bacterium]|nr:transglutaminase domain-containing protein [Candidatus Aminicenantes bacterium]